MVWSEGVVKSAPRATGGFGQCDAPGRELWLVYHRDLRDSLRVQAMRRFIEEVVPAAILG